MDDIIDRAARAYGGLNKLAAALHVLPQTVANWRKRGVPIERCAELEAITNCVVRRWEMRPKDWASIWPELIGTEGAPKTGAEPSPCTKQKKSRSRQRGSVLVVA
jgi:DNA-binding transcriptional regulator YdaS (Cro superfamily)